MWNFGFRMWRFGFRMLSVEIRDSSFEIPNSTSHIKWLVRSWEVARLMICVVNLVWNLIYNGMGARETLGGDDSEGFASRALALSLELLETPPMPGDGEEFLDSDLGWRLTACIRDDSDDPPLREPARSLVAYYVPGESDST